MEYEIRERCLTVFVEGELDHHTLRGISQEICGRIDLLMPVRLVLDMHGVRFMDSSGIALVLKSLRRMQELSGEVILRGVPPLPRKIFTIAGIDRYVKLEEGEKAV